MTNTKFVKLFFDRKIRYSFVLFLVVIISAIFLVFSGDYKYENILKISIFTFTALIFIILTIEVLIKFKRPFYFDYNEDVIYNIKWSWHWNLKKEILNLKPNCTQCGSEVFYRFDTLSNATEFICKNCNIQVANINSTHRNFAIEFVKKTIIRKLKKENPLF